jgi:pyruvate ferredoxin oxidoreductase beta subunit
MASQRNTVALRLPTEENFASGHRACIGCGEVLALRLVCKALGRDVIIANATGCMEIVSSQIPYTNWEVPWIHTLFENTSAVASGIEAGVKVLQRKNKGPKKEVTIVAMGGDGATADIGIQALSGAMERYHKFIYVCFDNEAYMNTGVQRSSATPFGASTTTSPPGKVKTGQATWKKDMMAIAVAHNIPYAATVNPSFPLDLIKKVQKAKQVNGPAYIHVYSPCPTGWRTGPEVSIKIGRMAVSTGVFPLYEVENGRYILKPDLPKLRPVKEYIKAQGRFKHLTDDLIEQIQKRVSLEYDKIRDKAAQSKSA